jgi:hypothetical protein
VGGTVRCLVRGVVRGPRSVARGRSACRRAA